jgi:hypothetical protein
MTIRDMRYVDENGNVLLRPEYARDVVEPDPDRIQEVFGITE